MHCLALIAYDVIYSFRDGRIHDTYSVLAEVEVFLHECVSNCSQVEELEAMILLVLGERYRADSRAQVARGMAQAAMQSLLYAQTAVAAERVLQQRQREREDSELRRLGRREGLCMEMHDADALPGQPWADKDKFGRPHK